MSWSLMRGGFGEMFEREMLVELVGCETEIAAW